MKPVNFTWETCHLQAQAHICAQGKKWSWSNARYLPHTLMERTKINPKSLAWHFHPGTPLLGLPIIILNHSTKHIAQNTSQCMCRQFPYPQTYQIRSKGTQKKTPKLRDQNHGLPGMGGDVRVLQWDESLRVLILWFHFNTPESITPILYLLHVHVPIAPRKNIRTSQY
jgi:hypothetical protein